MLHAETEASSAANKTSLCEVEEPIKKEPILATIKNICTILGYCYTCRSPVYGVLAGFQPFLSKELRNSEA